MGSSDSHDAFTEPGGNAPKHDDAFTQSNKDAPTGDPVTDKSPGPSMMEELLAQHWSQICEQRFKIVRGFMDWSRFDELPFPKYDTGGFIKGSELRDCQTGCEMLEKMGLHKTASFASIKQCGCKQFDEQLQFVNEEDKPLSSVDYVITRADGLKVKGTTDNEGKTKRIKNTQQEMAIEKVEFFASKWTQPLCPLSRIPVGTLLETVELAEKTTQANIGTSVKKVTLKGEDRPLTAGEIAMAKPVFKDSIDYGKVKVHKGKFWWAFGLQDDETAMVPFGKMYFPVTKSGFKEDFSKEIPRNKIWFMHEMTHVWQHQLGMFVPMKALALRVNGGYRYDNTNNPLPVGYRYDPESCAGKTLPDFNFEQQAEMVSHFFGAKYLGDKDCLLKIKFLESVLKNFLVNPKDKGLLPREPASTGHAAQYGIFEF